MIIPTDATHTPSTHQPYVTMAVILACTLVHAGISVPAQNAPAPDSPATHDYLQRRPWTWSWPDKFDILIDSYGYKPAHRSLLVGAASMWLHGDWMHLLFNMIYLWVFGRRVEYALGRVRYGLAYLLAGVGALAFYTLFDQYGVVPLIGASGAISGVLGAHMFLRPRGEVRTLLFVPPLFVGHMWLPVWLVIAWYMVVNNLLPIILGTYSSTAYNAHVGGFLAGVGVALVTLAWRRWRR